MLLLMIVMEVLLLDYFGRLVRLMLFGICDCSRECRLVQLLAAAAAAAADVASLLAAGHVDVPRLLLVAVVVVVVVVEQ